MVKRESTGFKKSPGRSSGIRRGDCPRLDMAMDDKSMVTIYPIKIVVG